MEKRLSYFISRRVYFGFSVLGLSVDWVGVWVLSLCRGCSSFGKSVYLGVVWFFFIVCCLKI